MKPTLKEQYERFFGELTENVNYDQIDDITVSLDKLWKLYWSFQEDQKNTEAENLLTEIKGHLQTVNKLWDRYQKEYL